MTEKQTLTPEYLEKRFADHNEMLKELRAKHPQPEHHLSFEERHQLRTSNLAARANAVEEVWTQVEHGAKTATKIAGEQALHHADHMGLTGDALKEHVNNAKRIAHPATQVRLLAEAMRNASPELRADLQDLSLLDKLHEVIERQPGQLRPSDNTIGRERVIKETLKQHPYLTVASKGAVRGY